jgi:hypothetical protein
MYNNNDYNVDDDKGFSLTEAEEAAEARLSNLYNHPQDAASIAEDDDSEARIIGRSGALLRQLGRGLIQATGRTRFDRVLNIADQVKSQVDKQIRSKEGNSEKKRGRSPSRGKGSKKSRKRSRSKRSAMAARM